MLSFGGPATFEPSAWEWAFRAGPLVRSDPARAREILAEGLATHPESGSLHYSVACLEAWGGNREAALASLHRALELRPDLAKWARDDADLESLRDDPEYRALVEL